MMGVAGEGASRQARAWRLGLFVLAGLGLLLVAALALLGRNLFTPHEHLSFEFRQSVQGLKAGSAVLLRGVRVGQVQRLVLAAPDMASGVLAGNPGSAPVASVVVAAQVERAALQTLLGAGAALAANAAQEANAAGPALQRLLVQRGLVARLASQSLLTGQAVVELDMGAAPTPAAMVALVARSGNEPLRIPTEASGISALQSKLEGLDVVALANELRAAAAATRQLAASASLATATVANAPLAPTLDEFKALAADLRRLSVQLDGKAGRISDSASGALGQVGRTAEQWAAVAAPAATAADRAARAAASVQAVAEGAQGPLNQSLASARQAADELAKTAATLRASVAPDSAMVQDIDRAAKEAAQAARSVRALADALERNPSALIWGRRGAAGAAPPQATTDGSAP